MDDKIIGRPDPPRKRSAAPYTDARLLVCAGCGYGAQMLLSPDRTCILGREPSCDLVLTDSRVSRRHARVQCEAGWYVINDLGSLYGLYVNNRRVKAHRLRHNDLIELGDTRLIFIAA